MKKILIEEIERQQKMDIIGKKLGLEVIVVSDKPNKSIKKEADFIYDCIISGWKFRKFYKL